MLSHISRFREAMDDTLIHRAGGLTFDRLAAYLGFPRPGVILQDYWRGALQASVYSARGTPGPLFLFLENVFGQWIDQCSTFTCTGLSLNLLEVPADLADNMQLQNRFCRIGDKLYRSSVLDGRDLTFINVDTTLFSKADFTALRQYEVKFLPFDIVEADAVYKVLLDRGIFTLPPTYLKTDASDVRGTGEPFGGQIMDLDSTVEGERFGFPLGDGPFPIYLAQDDFTSALGAGFTAMLVAGVRGVIEPYAHAQSTSLYGSYHQLLQYGTTDPGGPVLVEPTRG